MPSGVSSSSTSAWARVQSPFESHQSAASGADSSRGDSSSATDALNSSGLIFSSSHLQFHEGAAENSTQSNKDTNKVFIRNPALESSCLGVFVVSSFFPQHARESESTRSVLKVSNLRSPNSYQALNRLNQLF